MIVKYVEGSGSAIISNTFPVFAGRDWGNPREI
jgi:hypothetical protein